MKSIYKITVLDYNKLKNLSFEDSIKATYNIYRKGFDKVIEYIGEKPIRQRAGWTLLKDNIEYIITKC